MSDIRFNQWLHQSGTGGVSQSDGGHVGIGTTNPLIPVGAGNTHILNVGVVTCNNISAGSSITAGTFYGSGANLSSLNVTAIKSGGSVKAQANADGVFVTGILTATNFKTGVSNLHNLGLTLSSGQLDIGSNIKAGNAGVITATSFVGSGAQLTGITSPAITSIGSDGAGRVLTSDGDGTATAHSFVTIESSRLSVNRGSGSGAFPLIVRRTDASGIIAEFSNSSGYGIYLGQNSATGEAYIRTATGQPLVFTTNAGSGIANERLRITSAGNVSIADGNLSFAAGHGIDFSATSDGAGVDSSELFDDYEEGSWTPVANGFTASGTYHANYTKIGRMVHITLWIQTAAGSSGSPFYISGLPYTVGGGSNCYQYACGRLGSASFTNSANDIVFEFTPNNTTIFPKVQDGGMNWGMVSNTHVMVTGCYIVQT